MFAFMKPRPRRSEMRLGKRTFEYETAAFQPRLSLSPMLRSWQIQSAKIGAILLLFISIWLVYKLFTTPMFFVYGAQIQGNTAVSKQEIYQVSQIHLQSIFWLSPSEIESHIMALPNIKSAQVTLRLPAQVVIEVTERTPELLWQSGATTWWVDQEGTIVPPKGDTQGMLRIVDADQQAMEVGYQIDLTIIKGAQILQLLVPGLSQIQHSREHGLTVATAQGWPVYLGDGSEMKQKLVSLTAVIAHILETQITPLYIDMRDPLRPVYKEQPPIEIPQPFNNLPLRQPTRNAPRF